MADYIPDVDLSSLFNDDFDLGLASQNDFVTVSNCHGALYTSASGPHSSPHASPHEHVDSLVASSITFAESDLPMDLSAIVDEHSTTRQFVDDRNTWKQTLPIPVEDMNLDNFNLVSFQSHPIDLYYRLVDPHALLASPYTANTNLLQHTAHTAHLAVAAARPRKHICNIAPCHDVTFGRGHELRRHHASKHDLRNARFWCPIDGCDRSKREGGRAFPRKDKMVDHLIRVHQEKVSSAA